MKRANTPVTWLLILLVVAAVIVALSTDDKGVLALLDVGGKVLVLIAAVYSAYKSNAERKARGLSKEAFLVAEAGGPQGLLQQANRVRVVLCLLCALPFVSFAYAALSFSLDVAWQMLAIVSLISFPLALIIHWNHKRMRSVANAAAQREGASPRIDPYR